MTSPTAERCRYCGREAHPVRLTTERRHGTYINAAFDLHVGHSLTIERGLADLTLYCNDCRRSVIEAGDKGRWRGEYAMPICLQPGYQA
jgi:hypothetical protein